MFGNNPIRSVERDPTKLAIEGIFYTIQGEGPFAGCPALFIRLAGCNLACHFCDTQFEEHADDYKLTSDVVDDVVARFAPEQLKLVVITGGEPLRQDITKLCSDLITAGTRMIQIETAGTVWQEGLEHFISAGRLVIVCSPKTPKVHPKIALHTEHYKYIITAGETHPWDGLPSVGTQVATKDTPQRVYRPENFEMQNIWVSPCDSYEANQNQSNIAAVRDLALKYGYRVSLQMHKILGVE